MVGFFGLSLWHWKCITRIEKCQGVFMKESPAVRRISTRGLLWVIMAMSFIIFVHPKSYAYQLSGDFVGRIHMHPPRPVGWPPVASQCTLSCDPSETSNPSCVHKMDSCPQGSTCSKPDGTTVDASSDWQGTCRAWVDGIDFCSSSVACVVAHHGSGWTCSDDRTCQSVPIAGSLCVLSCDPSEISDPSCVHKMDSCPQGYSCNSSGAPNWQGTCQALVDGVDFCNSNQACVKYHGCGWICTDDRECQPPTPIQELWCALHQGGSK